MKPHLFTSRQTWILLLLLCLTVWVTAAVVLLWVKPIPTHPEAHATFTSVINLIVDRSTSTPQAPTALLTPIPTTTDTPEPAFTPTYTPTFAPGLVTYIVQEGDSLQSVSEFFGVPLQNLRAQNNMYGDTILPGQDLQIPIGITPAVADYHFSIMEGDLESAYPLEISSSRTRLHYARGTYPSLAVDELVAMVENGLTNAERIFQVTLPNQIDAYAAGTLFEPPNLGMRGQSYSRNLRFFFLFDGSGNIADQQYIIAHELTHVYMWNAFGPAVSPMLSEGAAVYAGMKMISGSNHLPIDVFCAAYLQVDRLPWVSSALKFDGHIFTLENYYAAGCFAGYLIDTYGPSAYGKVYSTNDFSSVYGKSLVELEGDWRSSLKSAGYPDCFDPVRLVKTVDRVENAYWDFLPKFTGTEKQAQAYMYLDRARIALLEGNLDQADKYLILFDEIRSR
jgi:LysM repeat protein